MRIKKIYTVSMINNLTLSAVNLPSHIRDDLPVLFMYGNRDVTMTVPQMRKASKFIPQLTNVELKGVWRCGLVWLVAVELSEATLAQSVGPLRCERSSSLRAAPKR